MIYENGVINSLSEYFMCSLQDSFFIYTFNSEEKFKILGLNENIFWGGIVN